MIPLTMAPIIASASNRPATGGTPPPATRGTPPPATGGTPPPPTARDEKGKRYDKPPPPPPTPPALPEMPLLETPKYEAPEEGSVAYQMDKNLASDSLLMQRARSKANQAANRAGQARGSMLAGKSMGAMAEAATPIATMDAATINASAMENWRSDRDTAVSQWQSDVNAAMADYSTRSQDFLKDKGYSAQMAQSMIVANNGLTNQFSTIAANILQNPDINNPEAIVDWLLNNLMKPAQESNNAFSGGIYSFT